MRLASYNIHGCVGGDRRRDPGRVLRVLAQLDADVLALQEVQSPDGGDDPLQLFARGLDCTAIAGPTLVRDGGVFGNALLTRRPILGLERVDLSLPGREPRGALDARIAHGSGTVRVISTHLGLRPAERREQIRRLLEHLGSGPETAILMGDLNEWWLWGRPLRSLRRAFERVPALPTFPARLPLLALDRIWVRPRARLRSVATCRRPPADIASDHLPIVATLAGSE